MSRKPAKPPDPEKPLTPNLFHVFVIANQRHVIGSGPDLICESRGMTCNPHHMHHEGGHPARQWLAISLLACCEFGSERVSESKKVTELRMFE
jgi:hypothetical protein